MELSAALAEVRREVCCECGGPLNLAGLTMHMGGARKVHRHCYERAHPPRAVTTIDEMARSAVEQVLAAELIRQMVPADLAAQIVAEFNRRLLDAWTQRCAL